MSTFKNLITLAQISDGAADGATESYYIESNYDEILRFSGLDTIDYSPATLTFKVFKMPLEENEDALKEFEYNLQIIFNEKIISIKNSPGVSKGRLVGSGDEDNVGTEELIQEDTVFFDVQTFIQESELEEANTAIKSGRPIFKFTLLDSNKNEVAIKTIECREGLTEEIAKFGVTAASINAAVGNNLLVFDATGLTLKNGAFSITNEFNEQLLYAEDGHLKIKGYIEAEGGSFTGELKSPRGNIGGFLIGNDLLSSESGSLILYGREGRVYAKNITLGEFANVEDYMLFPYYFKTQDKEKIEEKKYYIFNVEENKYSEFTGVFEDGQEYYEANLSYIYNPQKNNGKFIESNNILIKQGGLASFGDIQIDGPNSRIYGTNFNITPEQAIFKNVLVSGTIESSVFKTNSTQAAGGAMLFLPSYKIEGEIQNTIETDGDIQYPVARITVNEDVESFIEKGMNIWVVNNENEYTILIVIDVDKNVVIVDNPKNAIIKGTSILVIGNIEQQPLIMGINSGDTSIADNLIRGRGLTINTYGNKDMPNLFLGDLTSVNRTGYGLYSDNVYLNGSLTTKTIDSSYAGINTLNGYKATIFKEEGFEDESPIVFWAGSTDESENAIVASPFQVTTEGSVYAQKAILESSLLARSKIVASTIEGSEIYAAKIYGGKEQESAPLEIYDTAKGISFKTREEIETFSIGQNGLQAKIQDKNVNFITIKQNGIDFLGDSFSTTNAEGGYLKISRDKDGPIFHHIYNDQKKCGFYFRPDSTDFEISIENVSKKKMELSYQQVQLNDEVIFKATDIALQYSPNTGVGEEGYDLFII